MIGNSVGLGRQIAIATMLVGCLVIFYAWCGRALALDPALDVVQYGHTAWRVSEGFAKGRILAIAQTSDGYLWVGTELGLLRFDGVRTVPWQPPHGSALPDAHIRVLLGARDGTLWIGTPHGLAIWDGSRLVTYPQLANRVIDAIIQDHEGTVWIGAHTVESPGLLGLLCAVRGERIECEGEDGSLGIGVSSLYEDSNGFLWVAETGRMWRWKPGPRVEYVLPASIPALNALSELEPGVILIATSQGAFRLIGGKVEPSPLPLLSGLRPDKWLRDRDGVLWIGTREDGLYHVHEGRVDAFTEADGLSDSYVTALLEDREGNVWVASLNGLDRFRPYAAATYHRKHSFIGVPRAVLMTRDGSAWVSASRGLYRWRDGRTYRYRGERKPQADDPSRAPSPVDVVDVIVKGFPDEARSLHEDRQGRIWIGTNSGLGYIENGHFVTIDGVPGGYIDSISEDAHGSLWIAHRSAGLFQFSADRKLTRIAWSPDLNPDVAKHLAIDPVDGGIWVATGSMLAKVVGGDWHFFTARDGLAAGLMLDVVLDTGGSVFAGAEGGLSRLKNGRNATLDSAHGLPCDAVQILVEDDDRALWLYMTCGLVRIARSDLDAWFTAAENGKPPGTIRTLVLQAGDGVQTLSLGSLFRPVAAKSDDGKLWFVGEGSMIVVDPRHLPTNKLAPPVHVEQVVADHKTYDASSGAVRLPPLVRDVTIAYTALSFVAPEKVEFRFKLDGQDPEWRHVVNDRQVEYSNLAPGRYRFQVTASNNSGVWNEQGASLDISIAPAYWQTNWFRALVVLALLALAYTVYRLRVAQIARHFNATLDARVNERTRIARDLHDTLLQSFHGLLLRFQTARALLPANATKAAEVLDSAIDQAAGAITEGRDAVQGLRTSATEMNDLAESIRTLGDELATANGNSVVLRVDVQGASRALHPIVRDEVFRIASEALRNAFKHAGAEQIEVELHYDEGQVRLRVRDDGKGIAPELLRAEGRQGHFGLHGMRERAKLAGGKLVIWSGPDAGTEVELSIPASHAYSKASRPRSWLAEKVMGQGDSSDS